MCMKKFICLLLTIFLTSLSSFAANDGYNTDIVTVKRGYINNQYDDTQNETPKTYKKVPTQTQCSNSNTCVRIGFSKPRTRFSQPNTRFSQPNKRFSQPKVRCNNTYGQSRYYKTGMTQKYTKTTVYKYKKTIYQTSRFNKNYTIVQSKKVTCNGITYYNSSNACK